jgi:hypothetical protein
MLKIQERYKDHLYYPILVKIDGYTLIVEMQGKDVNAYNDSLPKLKYPKGCI